MQEDQFDQDISCSGGVAHTPIPRVDLSDGRKYGSLVMSPSRNREPPIMQVLLSGGKSDYDSVHNALRPVSFFRKWKWSKYVHRYLWFDGPIWFVISTRKGPAQRKSHWAVGRTDVLPASEAIPECPRTFD